VVEEMKGRANGSVVKRTKKLMWWIHRIYVLEAGICVRIGFGGSGCEYRVRI
jgi:hypothetical protein